MSVVDTILQTHLFKKLLLNSFLENPEATNIHKKIIRVFTFQNRLHSNLNQTGIEKCCLLCIWRFV